MELPSKHRVFRNAKWTDHLGNIVGKGPVVFVSKGAPGRMGQLGVLKLGPESLEPLEKALQEPLEPKLYEEILSDAQTALFEKNLRRSVLEMAIACFY